MRFLIGLILLAFPILEIWLLIELADSYGWLLLLYLVGIGWLGLQLIRQEKATLNGRMMQNIMAGANPLKVIFGTARNIIAGILLMLPGVMTDIIAAILLLIPIKTQALPDSQHQAQSYQDKPSANDDVIEGEFRRED